ncbi:MAG: hypothetical protein ABSD80_03935 [Caulobacteraceae bacterium]
MDLSSVPMFALPLIVIFCAVRFGGDLQNKRYPLAAWSALTSLLTVALMLQAILGVKHL